MIVVCKDTSFSNNSQIIQEKIVLLQAK